LAKGASVRDSVTLWNYGDTDLLFKIYAKDAFNTAEGGFDLLTATQPSTDVGGWVALEQSTVRVPARSGLPVPFTLTVPPNATPGDHAAGLVASLATSGAPDAERNVLVDHRVGSRLYLRVPGVLNPSLTIDEVEATYRHVVNPVGSGELDVTFTVTNAGNIRLKGSQKVTLSGPFGRTLQERALDDLPELLPGTSVRRTERFSVAPLVRISADVTITPIVGGGRTGDVVPEATTRSSSVWAMPWTLLAVLAALLVGWRITRRVRRRRSHPAATRPGGPSGSAAGSARGTGGSDDAGLVQDPRLDEDVVSAGSCANR
jgi:hypothetical protein